MSTTPRNLAPLGYWLGIPFLVLPLIIFGLSWLRQPIGISVISALVMISWRIRSIFGAREAEASGLTKGQLTFFLFFAFAFCCLAGVGGVAPQTADWLKHNLIIHQLMVNQWPFTISIEDRPFTFAYYFAFHLVPALAGKLGGWPAANLAALAFATTGLTAVLIISRAVSNARPATVVLATLLLGGLDAVPSLFLHLTGLGSGGEWWAGAFQYSHDLSLMLFVPNQAISGWLVTAILVLGFKRGKLIPAAAFVLPTSLLWSPFVTVGLGFLLLPLLVLDGNCARIRVRPVGEVWRTLGESKVEIALGVAVALPILLFFMLKIPLDERIFDPAGLGVRFSSVITGSDSHPGAAAGLYLAFVVVEFGVLGAILLVGLRSQADCSRLLLLSALASLMVIPLVRFGFFNDFVMRASIPALFSLNLLAMTVLARGTGGTRPFLWAYISLSGASGLAMSALEMRSTLARPVEQEVGTGGKYDLSCVQAKYIAQNRQNFLPQYLAPYHSDGLSAALLRTPTGDVPLSLGANARCGRSQSVLLESPAPPR